MKNNRFLKYVCLALICVMTLLSLTSCFSPSKEIGNHTELCEDFIESVVENDYDDAYKMVGAVINKAEFSDYWGKIQLVASGSTDAEIEQIGWNVSTSGGFTTSVTAHYVRFNNGKTILFRLTTRNDIDGIAGVYFSDVTEFTNKTDRPVSVINVILIIFSILSAAFGIWMLVDCIRRKIKRKALWIILILVGISLTLTTGETTGLKFMVGFIFYVSSSVADPALLSITTKIVVPVGAIVYFFLRKKLTVAPESIESASEDCKSPETSENSEE